MSKRMLIDAVRPEETRVVILGDHNRIEEFDFITSAKSQVKGNIYLAKVTRVEPSLQAAFVEYGGDKQGFLSFSEIHPDYYQIPIADRKRLIEEMERQLQEEAERDAQREQEDEARRARGDSPDEDGEDERSDDRPRGRRRSRRRTYSSRAREEGVAEMAVSSETIPESEMEAPADGEAPEDTAPASEQTELPAPAHVDSGEATEETPSTEAAVQEDNATQENDAELAEKPNTLDTNSDEETIERARKTNFSKRYRIQEVIKRGQIVLVQVIKEERGNKGVSLTTYISLAGRYCVLMPNASKDGGISRKVGKNDERKRLREIASELKESCGMSVIIRTAGLGRTKVEVKRDHEYLVKLWNMIREDALASTAPALIYEESDILKRSIRDCYEPDIEEILVQGDDAFKTAKEFMKLIMPSHAARVKQYTDDSPILSDFRVESQLEEMYQPIAKLRSGGYIVINHTEALISIDVNSGRSTSERNVEETALKTNLEAAREVARQLRLRDLGGLIVVDFIDMFYGKNRRAVERAFKDALRADRAKIQVGHISPFGLLELSRQRMRPSISETSTLPCPHCQGTGYIRSNDSMAIEIVRALEREASSGQFRELRVTVSTETALHMLNRTRHYLNDVEEKFAVTVVVKADHAYLTSQYNIEKIRRPADGSGQPPRKDNERRLQQVAHQRHEQAEDDETETMENVETGEEETQPRRRRSRGGRGRGRRRGNRDGAEMTPREEQQPEAAQEAQPAEAVEEPKAEEKPAPAKREPASKKEAAPKEEATVEDAPAKEKKPATRRKTATSTKSKTTADKPATEKRKTATTRKTATKKADAAEKAAASQKAADKATAVMTAIADETVPSGPARKGWWSKVMS